MTTILVIDPQFSGEPDIDAAEAGPGFLFEVVRTEPSSLSGETLSRADAVILCRSRWKLDAETVDRLGRARIVVQAGVGFNHIDTAACGRRGLPVCNTPDYGTREVADHAIGLTLALTRGIVAYSGRLQNGEATWGTAALALPPVRRLDGLVFGIIGLGRIGTATALRARALQMRVAFHDPNVPPGQDLALGLQRCGTLSELLGIADVVSLHCPLTAATRDLIGRDTIGLFKPGAILINTARGGVVDLDALEQGLRSGHVAAAGLDVLPAEPLDPSHPLLAAWLRRESWLEGRLVITPHAAFYTPESLVDMRRLSTRAAVEYLRDGTLRSCVNMPDLGNRAPVPYGKAADNGGAIERPA